MASGSAIVPEQHFAFGPFRLVPSRQLLLEGDLPVPLGGRALAVLLTLLERPGELVTKAELLARVWPDIHVEEGNLKVQVGRLRRALERDDDGPRYIATVTGRGYRFVAPVERGTAAPPPAFGAASPSGNLPPPATRIIGRQAEIAALMQELPRQRLVTIVGPGGIGKTTVALAVAGGLAASFEHGAWLVELGPIREPRFVAGALAAALGFSSYAEDSAAALITHLRDRRMLILLDNCEHLLGAAAALAEQIMAQAPGVHLLATSREPLGIREERLSRLPSLGNPPASVLVTAREAMDYSAVQLFVERATSSHDVFEMSDADAPFVAEICRRLDGIALAIELAATRADVFGVRDLLVLLDDRFRLLGQGARTADPRHQTLAATLDWSYELLSEDERTILRHLSVFAGAFTLEAACAVAADTQEAVPGLIDGLGRLVAKSLVSVDFGGPATQYRLLESTRAYALQKLAESGDQPLLQRRHAGHHRDLFERASAEAGRRPTEEWLGYYGRRIDEVRLALDWAFSDTGDPGLGVGLTIAAIPLWMQMSLLDECQGRVERALADGRPLAEADEMKLLTALGSASFFTRGPVPETGEAWSRALALAERLADSAYELRALWGLAVYRVYVGQYRSVIELMRRYGAIAARSGDVADQLGGERLMATALHYCGEQARARIGAEGMLARYVVPAHRSQVTRFQFDQRVAARGTLASALWLQGLPDQAVRMAQHAAEDARASGHPVSLCTALSHSTFPVALYVGDLAEAGRQLGMLREHLAKHPLVIWNRILLCLEGTLMIRHGDAGGLPILRNGLAELRETGYRLRYTSHLGTMAQGLAAAGRIGEAQATIDEALEWAERSGELWFVPELHRIRGELLLTEGAEDAAVAQLEGALAGARRQAARSWELRAATSLARHWHLSGETSRARQLLAPLHAGFDEGHDTADLRMARDLLGEMDGARRAKGPCDMRGDLCGAPR